VSLNKNNRIVLWPSLRSGPSRRMPPALVRYGADVVGAAYLRCEGEEFKVSSPAFRPQALGAPRNESASDASA